MAFNLIDERWIPVERRSGRFDVISPAGIADPDDPPLRVASPRPDFDGALLEFLVGLVQTAAAPKNEREWRRIYEGPPTVTELGKKFASVRDAFFLDGDGPRFMQDLRLDSEPEAGLEHIGALLVDRVGEDVLSEGPSLFAKPARCDTLGYPAAAASLMALQSFAPSGGKGHRTSLRGGGPLTTLIAGPDLWRLVWLNVLPREVFDELVPGTSSEEPGAVFPWLAPTRTSDGSRAKPTTPQLISRYQHLWGMPRRVRLSFQGEHGACMISGDRNIPVVRAYRVRNYGTNYKGSFRHPWTPYSEVDPGAAWNPLKADEDGLPYRDWPFLTLGGTGRAPAAVVSHFVRARRNEYVEQSRLMAFGYAMDSMKPLRWCCAETPLITVSANLSDKFATESAAFVAASEAVRRTLVSQVKTAWSNRPREDTALRALPGKLNPAFWSATEPAFFSAVHAVKNAIEAADVKARDVASEAWLEALHSASVKLFDRFVDASASLAPPDLRRVVKARASLIAFTRPSSVKLRKVLSLPVEEAKPESWPTRVSKGRKEKSK